MPRRVARLFTAAAAARRSPLAARRWPPAAAAHRPPLPLPLLLPLLLPLPLPLLLPLPLPPAAAACLPARPLDRSPKPPIQFRPGRRRAAPILACMNQGLRWFAAISIRRAAACVLSVVVVVVVVGCRSPAPAPASQRASDPARPRATLAITHVRVFDGERAIPDATVLVDGERIAAVGRDLGVPAGAEVVDGRGQTLLPGLIDAHVHAYEDDALVQALAFGVTTVLDMFAPPSIFALRDHPQPDRADLRSSGILATAPQGHGTEYGVPVPTLTRPDEAQAWVDARIAEGSDYIKIVYDDGRAYRWPIPTLDDPTFQAVVDATHHRGKLAVVHVGDYEHARRAIAYGADGLVHLFRDQLPPAGFAAEVARRHAFVTPTLSQSQLPYDGPTQLAEDPAIAPFLLPRATRNLHSPRNLTLTAPPGMVATTIGQLRDAGVTILCGTDAPNPGTAQGASMHDELALLVAAGLSPTAALHAATAAPAKTFGLTDRGRIAAGLRADLLLVRGDPTVDVRASRQITAIWHAGHRFDREAYRRDVEVKVAAARASEQPVPARELGVISDFEEGVAARLGQPWRSTASQGSSATLTVVAGAHGSHGALEIRGSLAPAATPLRWAGAAWWPSADSTLSANLSAGPGLRFLARGDGKPYSVMVFTRRGGWTPRVRTFTPRATAAEVRFSWRDFDGYDGSDVDQVFIGQTAVDGPFALVIDDVAIQ